MNMFNMEQIETALARHSPRAARSNDRRAAVAIVLAGREDHLHLCLIRRASFETDVWSGHMALPGGLARLSETQAASIAEREAREEVGLELVESHRKGTLADISIRLAGRGDGLTLSPVVYFIGEELLALRPGEEVAEALWAPVSELWNAGNATYLRLPDKGDLLSYPAIRVGPHVVWGVTLRVLTLFSDVIGYPLAHFEEIPGLRDV